MRRFFFLMIGSRRRRFLIVSGAAAAFFFVLFFPLSLPFNIINSLFFSAGKEDNSSSNLFTRNWTKVGDLLEDIWIFFSKNKLHTHTNEMSSKTKNKGRESVNNGD